jgi:GMP synthase-like glutamine amidotransferase
MTEHVLTLGHLGMGTGTHRPFDRVYPKSLYLAQPTEILEGAPIDALVIWGGADISPTLYRDAVADFTGADAEPSRRDKVEVDACQYAIERKIPIIGVCRGAQLVCALAGGRLIQHVDNHAGGYHDIDTFDGKVVRSSSVHHQMMYPFDVPDHQLVAWSSQPRSKRYIIGTNETDPKMEGKPEPEIVWFPNIRALAIQGHPEFHQKPDEDPFVQYCLELVREKFLSAEEV